MSGLDDRALMTLRFDAIARAQSARLAPLFQREIDDLVRRAQLLLPDADPLRLAIERYGRDVAQVRASDRCPNGYRAGFIACGIDFVEAVRRALRPDPVGIERADIYG